MKTNSNKVRKTSDKMVCEGSPVDISSIRWEELLQKVGF